MPLTDVEKRILGEANRTTEPMENLRVLCDEYGGRVAGSQENREASEFLVAKFEEYGFEDPHLESFRFPGCETGESRLEIIEPVRKTLPCLSLPMTASGVAEAEVMFLDAGEPVGEDAVGKIIVSPVRPPAARDPESGIAGFIWAHPYPAMGPPTGCVNSVVPSVSIRFEEWAYLSRLLERHGSLRVSVEAECNIFERESWNVCGEVKGSGDSDKFILLGGHIDGHEVAQAAFDCGAPCTAVTEMARILGTESSSLNGDVRVVCFSSEEYGCWGSKDYTKRHRSELENLLFTYQLDCCGGGRPQMVTTDLWPSLEPLYTGLAEDTGMTIPHDQRRGPGDSRAFFELGIPTGSIIDQRKTGMMELLKTWRHTVYDTYDKISVKSMREVVAIGALSGLRMLEMEDFPAHRSPEAIEEARRKIVL